MIDYGLSNILQKLFTLSSRIKFMENWKVRTNSEGEKVKSVGF